MLKYFFEQLKLIFSFRKTNSPSTKNKNGNSLINTGNNSQQQNAGRDIYNFSGITPLNEAPGNIKALLDLFSIKQAHKIYDDITDPRNQQHLERNNKGLKKFVSDKFKIALNQPNNYNTSLLFSIKDKAIDSIDSLSKSHDQEVFMKAWALYLCTLDSMLNVEHKEK